MDTNAFCLYNSCECFGAFLFYCCKEADVICFPHIVVFFLYQVCLWDHFFNEGWPSIYRLIIYHLQRLVPLLQLQPLSVSSSACKTEAMSPLAQDDSVFLHSGSFPAALERPLTFFKKFVAARYPSVSFSFPSPSAFSPLLLRFISTPTTFATADTDSTTASSVDDLRKLTQSSFDDDVISPSFLPHCSDHRLVDVMLTCKVMNINTFIICTLLKYVPVLLKVLI